MMSIIGRGLQALSQVDEKTRKELSSLPDNFTFEMKVLPDSAGFVVTKNEKNELIYIGSRPKTKPDVSIAIKHPTLALLIFTFQESTAIAFAHDRTLVNGDISMTMRTVRCLDRLESIILPKSIATLAVKHYPTNLPFIEKITIASKVYTRILLNLFIRNNQYE